MCKKGLRPEELFLWSPKRCHHWMECITKWNIS